jgi:hypothetical protein
MAAAIGPPAMASTTATSDSAPAIHHCNKWSGYIENSWQKKEKLKAVGHLLLAREKPKRNWLPFYVIPSHSTNLSTSCVRLASECANLQQYHRIIWNPKNSNQI